MSGPNFSKIQSPTCINDGCNSAIGGNLVGGLILLAAPFFMDLRAIENDGPAQKIINVAVIAFGLLMLAGAGYLLRQCLKFGTAKLLLTAAPVTVGGTLSGTIKISKPLQDFESLELRFRYVNQRLRLRRHHPEEDTLWTHTLSLKREQLVFSDGITLVPVNVTIPEAVPVVKAGRWLKPGTCCYMTVTAFPNRKPRFYASFPIPLVDNRVRP